MSEDTVLKIKHDSLFQPGATTEYITSVYDEWANKYDKDVGKFCYEAPSKFAALFSEACSNKDASIIDWGSGTGLLGAKLSDNGFTNLTALDISQKSLDVAAKMGVYNKLTSLGDSKTLFKDDEFDAVVCCGCIVPNHVSPHTFYEWVRIVKPGGLIGIAKRRDAVQAVEAEEELKIEFDQVVRDLENKKMWKVLSATEFNYYMAPEVVGLSLIYEVL